MDHIDTYLTNAASNDNLSPAIRAALLLGKKTMNKYYDKTDHSELYRIAMSTGSCSTYDVKAHIVDSPPSPPQARLLQECRLG